MTIRKLKLGKYTVYVPAETLRQIRSEGSQLYVRNTRTTKGIVHNVCVFQKDSFVMLGRYMLNARKNQTLKFKDGNRLNLTPDNIYLEDQCLRFKSSPSL